MELARPLTIEMVRTANEIHEQLDDWQATDRALIMMRDRLPGFSFEEILLKANAVNTLYATNVYAILKAAKHVHYLMTNKSPEEVNIDLVEKMAKVPGTATKKSKSDRNFVSFASKFAHFFIDEKFPIKDSYAESTIRYHLGCDNWEKHPGQPYHEFVVNLQKLKDSCFFTGSVREFDHYLWLSGQFKEWQKNQAKAEINQETKSFFENESNQEILRRAFGEACNRR